ncbi:hypothetical protein KIPB_005137, partial [Kipferlia bialata]
FRIRRSSSQLASRGTVEREERRRKEVRVLNSLLHSVPLRPGYRDDRQRDLEEARGQDTVRSVRPLSRVKTPQEVYRREIGAYRDQNAPQHQPPPPSRERAASRERASSRERGSSRASSRESQRVVRSRERERERERELSRDNDGVTGWKTDRCNTADELEREALRAAYTLAARHSGKRSGSHDADERILKPSTPSVQGIYKETPTLSARERERERHREREREMRVERETTQRPVDEVRNGRWTPTRSRVGYDAKS